MWAAKVSAVLVKTIQLCQAIERKMAQAFCKSGDIHDDI